MSTIALTQVSDAFYPEVPVAVWSPPDINIGDLGVDSYAIDIGSPPSPTLNFEMPEMEQLATLTPIDIAISLDWPTLSAEKPVLDFTGTPDDFDGDAYAPGAPPETAEVALPDVPVMTIPEAPVIGEVYIPTMPEVTIEDFDETLILQEIPATEALDFVMTNYLSDIRGALAAKIFERILIGGTGLEAAVEDAIFAREVYRVDQQFTKGTGDILSFFESRGWSLPSGVMAGRLDEAIRGRDRALADTSNGIMVKQAELAKEEGQFILKTGIDFEQLCQALFLEETKIRLDAARTVAEHNIAVINAAIATNNAAIEAYKALSAVYNTKVQAALAKIELFKAQIEAAKVDAETKKLLVDIYNSLLQGVLTEAEIYKTQMQGAEIAMGIQRTKLEVYTARVGAFTAMVQAWATEWKAYEAKVSGQTARVQAYSTEVSAYETQVKATSAVASVSIEEARLKMEANKQTIDMNSAKLQVFQAKLQAALGLLDAEVKVFDGEIKAYTAKVGAITAEYEAHYRVGSLKIEAAKTKALTATEVAKLSSSVAIANAQISGEINRSVIAGMATIRASIAGQSHNSGSRSTSTSTNRSDIESNSTSTSSSTSTIAQTQSITSASTQLSVVQQFITSN